MVATDPTGWTSHTDDFHRGMTWKLAVRAATTASITISTALNNADVLDGVTLATGDRVLVKDQATGSQNGIYIVSASPARAPDMDQDSTTSVPAQEVMGAIVYVIAGTVNAGTSWRNTNTTAPTIGTTALTFAAFGGAAGAVTTSGLTMATARLLGRTTAATGAIEEITVGSGLTLAAGSLTASGGSGTVTTVEEVDGSPTDSAVTKIVFPNGTLAIASHVATYTPAGGSSSIVRPALKGTPDDDFDAATIDAAWSAHSASGSFDLSKSYPAQIDGSFLSLGFKASFGTMYRSTSNADQEVILGDVRLRGSVGNGQTSMPGIGLLDASGDGTAIVIYNDNNLYLANIVNYNYNGNSGNISGIGHGGGSGDTFGDQHWWLRLTRVGNVFDGYASLHGDAWSYHMSATRTVTHTITEIHVGQFLSTVTGAMEIEWYDKV